MPNAFTAVVQQLNALVLVDVACVMETQKQLSWWAAAMAFAPQCMPNGAGWWPFALSCSSWWTLHV
jgi:hypothetical protein